MWDWAIWGALILAALASISALTLLVMRARKGWNDVMDTRRDVVRRLDDFAAKAEATAEKIAAATDTQGLDESIERLHVSLAQLAVLRSALADSQDTVGRVTAYLPRK